MLEAVASLTTPHLFNIYHTDIKFYVHLTYYFNTRKDYVFANVGHVAPGQSFSLSL